MNDVSNSSDRAFRLSPRIAAIAAFIVCCAASAPSALAGGGFTLYVDDDAPPGGDGLSWATAFRDLHDAVNYLGFENSHSPPTVIRLGAGTYLPAPPGGDPEISFFMPGNTVFEGGYAGYGAPDPDLRDPAAFVTTISGDLRGDDDSGGTTDNTHNLFVGDETYKTVKMSGLTFSGTVKSVFRAIKHGGLFLELTECTIEKCFGDYVFDAQDEFTVLTLADTLIRDNIVKSVSGSLYKCYLTATNCTITDNVTTDGIFVGDIRYATVLDALITGNTGATIFGVEYAEDVAMTGCLVTDNVCTNVLNIHDAKSAKIDQCTITGNTVVDVVRVTDWIPSLTIKDSLLTTGTASNAHVVFQSEYITCHLLAYDSVFIGKISSSQVFAANTVFQDGSVGTGNVKLVNCLLQDANVGVSGFVYGGGGIGQIFNSTFVRSGLGGFHSGEINAVNCRFFDVDKVTSTDDFKIALRNCLIVNAKTLAYPKYSGIYFYNCIIYGYETYLKPDAFPSGGLVIKNSLIHPFVPGPGNFDADPKFVDPARGDYRLGPLSPCIDRGDNSQAFADTLDLDGDGDVDEPVPFDFDGNPRFVDDPGTPDRGRTPIIDVGPYEYQVDCNDNGVYDVDETADGSAADCNGNMIPDECESPADCNGNGEPDICDTAAGREADCDGNGVPDWCELPDADCNGNGILDACDILNGTETDCVGTLVPDSCKIAQEGYDDCNGNGIPDFCEPVTNLLAFFITYDLVEMSDGAILAKSSAVDTYQLYFMFTGPKPKKEDFVVTEVGGDGIAPTVTGVGGGSTFMGVALSSNLEPGTWTTIKVKEGCSYTVGYLPGDVNGDGVTSSGDVLAVIDAMNGVIALPARANVTGDLAITQADLDALLALLQGGAYLTALPPMP